MSMLWKARGLEAVERLEATKDEDVGPPNSPRRFELLLEFAFTSQVTMPEVVQKPYQKDGHAFHVILKAENEELFDLAYLYEDGRNISATRIDRLPKGWQIVMDVAGLDTAVLLRRERLGIQSATRPRPLLVSANGVPLVFDLADPFHPFPLEYLAGRSPPKKAKNVSRRRAPLTEQPATELSATELLNESRGIRLVKDEE
jgi:hypothetical protein